MRVPETYEDITLAWFNTIFSPHHIQVHAFTLGNDVTNGRGFMGQLQEVKLEISRLANNSDDPENELLSSSPQKREELSIVLKTLPNDTFRRQYAANDGFTRRELCMYTEVFKEWDEFLDARQVPRTNRYRHPICYYGAEEGEGENYKYILVLENLLSKMPDEKRQFHLWDLGFFEPLPLAAASAVIREIAKFHATGIAYKMEKGDNDDFDYSKRFPQLNHIISPMFKMMWDNGHEIVKEVIKTVLEKHEIPDGLFEQLDKLHEDDSMNLILRWFTDPKIFKDCKYVTLCHNDLHSNNLVLNGDHSCATLFDYQAPVIFNPMKDLSFFLVLNCDSDLAIKNLSMALQLYRDEFQKTMSALKLDFQYSMENLAKDYNRFLAFTIAHIKTGAQVWVTGTGSTVLSKRRFALAVVDAYKKGSLKYPEL